MIDDKKPAPEGEVYIYGNTKVEFRKDGLTFTVGEGEEPALTPNSMAAEQDTGSSGIFAGTVPEHLFDEGEVRT